MKPAHALGALVALAAALGLSGCAAFSPDGGMSVVVETAARALDKEVVAIRTPEGAAAVRAKVERLLRRPLTADAAVQIALLNNRGLQAAYNALGLAEAGLVEASLPPNPTVSFGRLSGSAVLEVEKRVVANILALATLPTRAEIAKVRFRQAQLRAAEETLRLAAETRRAYYRAVAAREAIGFLTQAAAAAETAWRLARRLGETGAMNKLDQAREHVFYAELTAQLARARQHAMSERERLTRLMGLWGEDVDFKLPNALPPLPRRPKTMPEVEVEAVKRRVDLQIAGLEVAALARSLGLAQATRFVTLGELAGIARTDEERTTGERIRSRGFEIELELPVFDLGEVRTRQAEETYLQALNRLTERAVVVRSEAREAYRSYRSTYDIARHYRREVLPLRQIISEEVLLRYNAMQIDVFALLAEARQRIGSTVAAIEAQRDFWVASVDLDTAIVGGGAGAVAGGAALATPAAAAGGNGGGH